MIYEDMKLDEVVSYINSELIKGRSMKDIEENDFNVNERVITKRLARKNIKKIDGQFVFINSYKKPEAIKTQDIVKSNKIINPSNNIKLIENQEFLNLSKKVDMIEKVLEEVICIQKSSHMVTGDLGLRIASYEDKPIPKTVRLYKEIWDKIDMVKEQFPHLNYQTLLNSLIDEITEKYLTSNNYNQDL